MLVNKLLSTNSPGTETDESQDKCTYTIEPMNSIKSSQSPTGLTKDTCHTSFSGA